VHGDGSPASIWKQENRPRALPEFTKYSNSSIHSPLASAMMKVLGYIFRLVERMKNVKNLPRVFLQLAMAVMLLSGVLSIIGLSWDGLYQDTNSFILEGWRINDWVTLLFAVPLFAVALILAKQGSKRGHALLTGLMMFTIYNYSYYLFGAAFNAAFLGYVLVFILGLFGVLTGAFTLFPLLSKTDFPSVRVSRIISTYMILTAVFLSIGWVGQWVNFVVKGIKPPLLEQLGATNHLVAALDMTFVVPWFLLGAVLLWKKSTLGLLISLMVHVKTVIYNVILLWGSINQHNSGIDGAADLIPLWGFFLLGSALSINWLLKTIRK
jgi:hypothetical protein